jgi:hypothetical protein
VVSQIALDGQPAKGGESEPPPCNRFVLVKELFQASQTFGALFPRQCFVPDADDLLLMSI